MKATWVFNENLNDQMRSDLVSIIKNFDDIEGGKGKRNVIKIVDFENFQLNIKAFKIPNLVNQIAYNFIRNSKAQRSFEYAQKLLAMDILTPKPLAYFESVDNGLFKESYYLSEHLQCDLTFRRLTTDFDYPDYDQILRAFTRFTYELHQKNVHFLDHSPGNTLIKKTKVGYDFYLVDLNRMKFEPLDYHARIKNFSRLTIHKSMVEVMSEEYAMLMGKNKKEVFDLMWKETQDFQYKFHRKKRIKQVLKFWKQS